MRPRQRTLAAVSAVAIGVLTISLLGGCSSVMNTLRPASKHPKAPVTTGSNQVDVRRYLGPDYCPELHIYDGAQLIRTYERGHQGDQNFVTWQASISKTARECLYDQMGALTIKVGVSGRALTGPKGEGGAVTIPIKIAIVKFKESVLTSERYSESVTIPPAGSTVFSAVKEISVPSPGPKHDYLIYVGFDIGDWDPLNPGGPAIAAIEPPAPAVAPSLAPIEAPAEAPPNPATTAKPLAPNELPTPTGGFVLTQ